MMAVAVPSGSAAGAATTRQADVMWFSRPQGEPSGVCTGHRKPQDSGSSLRTVVVRSCAKYAPRCTDRKCDIYLHSRVLCHDLTGGATNAAKRCEPAGCCAAECGREVLTTASGSNSGSSTADNQHGLIMQRMSSC